MKARRLSAPVSGSVCALVRWSSSSRSLDSDTSSTDKQDGVGEHRPD